MRTFVSKFLQSKVMQAGGLLALGAAAVATIAWTEESLRQYKLGGEFIGAGGGLLWSASQVPLDPAGRTASIRVTALSYGADFAGLLAMFGADEVTASTGQAQMISQDTAKWRVVAYGMKQGNPPAICQLQVYVGTLTFTEPDSFTINYTLDVYPGPANILGLPNADADGDGFPDPGTTPMLSVPGSGAAKRVLP